METGKHLFTWRQIPVEYKAEEMWQQFKLQLNYKIYIRIDQLAEDTGSRTEELAAAMIEMDGGNGSLKAEFARPYDDE